MYIAEAAFALLSEAATLWIPARAAGTVNGQALKLPVASVVQDVETLLPSKVTVMVPFRAKPLPVTAALLPTAPMLGARLMAGLTVKVELVVPAFVPSDAVTGWLPAVAAGTVYAQALKRPLALAVQDVATLLPLKLTAMGANGAKPLPLTAAGMPTAPALGLRLMARVTVKVALPEYVPSDTATVWGPAVVAGTVNAQVLLAGRLPLASVVQVPDVLSAALSNWTVRVLLGV